MSEPEHVRVGADQILTVTADVGSYGSVFQDGTTSQWTVSAKSPLRLGSGMYRVETVMGTVRHSLDGGTPDAPISNKGTTRMPSLHDKFKHLMDRANSVPAALAQRADNLGARLDALESRGHPALDRLDSVLTDAEQGVTAAEDAVNVLTNGGPN